MVRLAGKEVEQGACAFPESIRARSGRQKVVVVGRQGSDVCGGEGIKQVRVWRPELMTRTEATSGATTLQCSRKGSSQAPRRG